MKMDHSFKQDEHKLLQKNKTSSDNPVFTWFSILRKKGRNTLELKTTCFRKKTL